MNLLQQLVNMVHGSHPDPRNIIQPGQKFSPAVQAQNQAPVQNTYNSQGQPTQEVFADPTRPFSQQPFQPIAPAVPQAPAPLAGGQHSQFQPMANVVPRGRAPLAGGPRHQGFSLQSVANMMPQQSQLQGRDNPGLIPLQSSPYGVHQPQSAAYDSQLQGTYQRPIVNPQQAYQPYQPY